MPLLLGLLGGSAGGGGGTPLDADDDRRLSYMDIMSPWRGILPLPGTPFGDTADQQVFLFLSRDPLAAGSVLPSTGLDWLDTEIGRWVRGITNQFDGHLTLARWKAEALAAAQAGPTYPWFTSELQRRFLDYFISVQ